MHELERESQQNRMQECIRIAEAAYDELYEPRTHNNPAGHYTDVKDFYGEAIGLARKLGLNDEAARLEKRLAHIKEVFRNQFEKHDSNPVLVKLWPPATVSDEAREQMKILIHRNASYVVGICQTLTDFGFLYDAESVKWLDGFINDLRAKPGTAEDHDDLVSQLGAYLGQAIVENYGGVWDIDDQGWHVRFDEQNRAYPLGKVAKQLANGAEDSIFSFYSAIPLLFGADGPGAKH
jgi:hypothetical protein